MLFKRMREILALALRDHKAALAHWHRLLAAHRLARGDEQDRLERQVDAAMNRCAVTEARYLRCLSDYSAKSKMFRH
jgi:hypothetical protein